LLEQLPDCDILHADKGYDAFGAHRPSTRVEEIMPRNGQLWSKAAACAASQLTELLCSAELHFRFRCYRTPFLGSGSTLIAADRTGRVCRGVELDPLYVDVIIRRYDAASGQAAVLVYTGETFKELEARRATEAA
jgi:hypothetical protein